MSRQHERMHRTQHYLPRQQFEQLNRVSAATGITTSEHLRRALDAYLVCQKPVVEKFEREEVLQETRSRQLPREGL